MLNQEGGRQRFRCRQPAPTSEILRTARTGPTSFLPPIPRQEFCKRRFPHPEKASKVLRPEAGWAGSPGWFNWLEPPKYADAEKKKCHFRKLRTSGHSSRRKAERCRVPTLLGFAPVGVHFARSPGHCASACRALALGTSSRGVPVSPASSSPGRHGAFWVLWFKSEARASSGGVPGLLELQLPACPARGHGASALDGLSRQEPRIRGPGKLAAAGGGSARARRAGPVLFCPNHCKQAEAGRGGNGAPAGGQGGSAGGGGRGGRVSARRRRLQRSRRSLGGRHWSVAGERSLAGVAALRRGARASRRLAPGLAPAPVRRHAGLGIPGSELELGVGGVAAAPSVLQEGSPAPPKLAHLGVGHAACLAACRRGLPECSRLCPVLFPEPRTIREPSWFLGASRPRGICASHTWPEQRRGLDLPQAVRLASCTWCAHLSPRWQGGVGE